MPHLVRNFGTFEVSLNWYEFDFGKRHAELRRREAQLAQAEASLHRLKEEVGSSENTTSLSGQRIWSRAETNS